MSIEFVVAQILRYLQSIAGRQNNTPTTRDTPLTGLKITSKTDSPTTG